MTWVKIDDTLPGNPKVRGVSVAARWAYLSSICYASQHQTDGFVPSSVLDLVSGTPRLAAELVGAGLWETAANGWLIHDYLKHNRSRANIAERQQIYQRNGSARAANSSAIRSANGAAKQKLLPLSVSGSLSEPSDPPIRSQEETTEQESKLLANSSGPSDERFAAVVREWERATGTLITGATGDGISQALADLPEDWVRDAIRLTGENGKRSWNYTRGILANWQTDGRDVKAETDDPSEAARKRYLGGSMSHLVANQ